MPVVEIEIPPRSPYVGVVRLAITALGRTAGLGEEAIDDLKIAVSEACANAVLAHEEAGIEVPVAVRWSDEDERVVVDVDQGTAMMEEEQTEDSHGFSSRLVLSTALLESLVDECEYSTQDGGTRTHLVMRKH